MTAISATQGSSYQSPLQKLQDALQAQVSSGAISSSDQGALSSALTDINSSLQDGNTGNSASSTNSPPGDLQSKINNLIAGEVSSGNLTSAQAKELQGVFQTAFAKGDGSDGGAAGAGGAGSAAVGGDASAPGARGAHHAHHHGGHGGAPPADNSSSAGSTSSGSSGASSPDDILQQFLQSLQNSLSASSSPSYNATGASDPGGSSSGASFSALLINYQT